MEDLGIAAAPFHVGTLDFSGIQSRLALFVNGVLFVQHIEGGPNTRIFVNGAAHVSGSVLNQTVDFLNDGSAFYVGKESTGSHFEFINTFDGAKGTLIFQRPEENSQASITVDTFLAAKSWSDRIELHGLDFDAASMVPGTDKLALTLKGSPVFELDHVHVANPGGLSPEPVLKTGFDLQTGNNFVSFNGPPSTSSMG